MFQQIKFGYRLRIVIVLLASFFKWQEDQGASTDKNIENCISEEALIEGLGMGIQLVLCFNKILWNTMNNDIPFYTYECI